MSIINYTDEVSYRFTTLFFQLFGRGVKHIMVLDTFLPLHLGSTEKVGRPLLVSSISFLCFWYWSSDLASIVIPWKPHRLLEPPPELLYVSQSWGLIICISNKSSGAGAADLAFSE